MYCFITFIFFIFKKSRFLVATQRPYVVYIYTYMYDIAALPAAAVNRELRLESNTMAIHQRFYFFSVFQNTILQQQ